MSLRTLILTAFTTLSPATGPPFASNLLDIKLPGEHMAIGAHVSGGAISTRGLEVNLANGRDHGNAGRSAPASSLASSGSHSQITGDHGDVAGAPGVGTSSGAHAGRAPVQMVSADVADSFAGTGAAPYGNSFERGAQASSIAGGSHFETGQAGLPAGSQSRGNGIGGGAPSFAGNGTGSGGAIDGATTGVVVAVSAVPEPETYALMLAGLGLMGSIVQRRKNKPQAD
ncbi:MAG: hypothetical protein RL211_989 [Pseudomonadota bacterium]